MELQQIIEELHRETLSHPDRGKPADYIPELAAVDPEKFGICLNSIDDRYYCAGDCNERFSIQSIAKVLSLSLVFGMQGRKIWQRVGVEPAGTPFNSLVQLEYESGIPRNPFVNAGALVICDMLISQLDEPKKEMLAFIREISGTPDVAYSPSTVASEFSEGYRNFALINLIRSFGNIYNDVEEVLDFYFHLCSVKMSCVELSRTFRHLANEGRDKQSGKRILTKSQAKRINAIMMSCGFYDEAGEFAYEVGLPGKSGVGGGIVAVHPLQYSIAVWSPRLNPKGNSYRGLKFLERFTTRTESSIF
jgi:glutaminase